MPLGASHTSQVFSSTVFFAHQRNFATVYLDTLRDIALWAVRTLFKIKIPAFFDNMKYEILKTSLNKLPTDGPVQYRAV
jgi:hypothetical protein